MSKRQMRKMLGLMAGGEPVELTSAMASVKKLARLAFVAQQFGYEYADVRQGGGQNASLRMLIVPDPSPQARARAAQNRAQYPNAGDGVSLPPLVPDAFELLKARINFDLTGKNAEKRMGYGALGLSIGCVILAYRSGGASSDFVVAGVIWLLLMTAFGIGFVVTRRRNAKFAARLRAAGFTPVTDETGRVRYLPPGGQTPGHGNPLGGNPYGGNSYGGAPYGAPGAAPAPYAQQGPYAQQAPGPYAQQAPGPYAQQAPGSYAQPAPAATPAVHGTPPAPVPYGTPQQPPVPGGPYAQPQPPYGQPVQPPYPRHNAYGQPPQR
ncbi:MULTISPECIES: hypothetical protein [unclassified Streptomyces]|uniref:hypothetical protein n=1 Tax=unclassified Streptomyces TaxID=2593676 RepID=UPI00073B765B|nr:hypothetical protein [Streptomyces sp. AVP053U2]ODA75123.1 hypothetical protein APS67_000837 [Streptomyces sp. AVP053U2]